MHGVVGKALWSFARDTLGADGWARLAAEADAPPEGYVSVRRYDEAGVRRLADALAARMGTSREDMLVDAGVYLVAHPSAEPLRRLMRFTGADFDGFVHALEDLPARGRLALPGVNLPAIEVRARAAGPERRSYAVTCRSNHAGAGHLLLGVLRSMADDYGALATIWHEGGHIERGLSVERLTVEILLESYTGGRGFDLAGIAA